jgi:hypothetical protein
MPVDGAGNNRGRSTSMSVDAPAGVSAIELFLSPDGAGQSLRRGLSGSALSVAPGADAPPEARPGGPEIENFLDPGGDPSSLRDQGWGVIVPRGAAGERLLALARPLIERRAAEQECEVDQVPIYRVPADLTAVQATAWIDRELVGNKLFGEIPGYLLVLGRPDELSFEFQQALGGGFCIGRLGFDADAGYEAYIAKLLAAERAPPRVPQAVYFTARDGTPATELGRRLLMQPCLADAEQQRAAGKFEAAEIVAIEDDDPVRAADRLLAAAADAGVVFSCSHGAGSPLDGWDSPSRRAALQGALCLGGGRRLEAEELARARFAPGGVWLLFACFGAGTPRTSAYEYWLARLAEAGEHSGDLGPVRASLPRDGEPAFLAALPQAALANPDGPLAVIGHLDLAWSYGFCDIDKMSRGERHRRFHELVAMLVRGTRVGLSLGGSLMRARSRLHDEIVAAADEAAARRDEDPQLRFGHRWMVRQDLAGYIALGDPAARLVVPHRSEARDARSAERTATAASRVAPEIATAAPARSVSTADIEASVHALIAGRATPGELAARHGVPEALVEDWRRVYTDAGRRALAELVAAAGSPPRSPASGR